ncbi:MAG: nucleotide exchange factor GrpE [Simkaniaceae bacterium]|nr:nucleotide exchange factor GrpE [Candidatus Sacchlamyda saccharinae]
MTEEEEKIEELETPEVEQEEDNFKDKYFRLLAEMENSRKRLQKEKHEMNRFAVENVIAEILLPIDTFENALSFTDQMSDDTRNWAKGFEMILNQFKEMLEAHNVKAFTSEGKMFDPNMHEAVEIEETEDQPDGTILKEFLKGYKSGDRVLRAARVKVAKAPSKEESQEEEKGENHDEEKK